MRAPLALLLSFRCPTSHKFTIDCAGLQALCCVKSASQTRREEVMIHGWGLRLETRNERQKGVSSSFNYNIHCNNSNNSNSISMSNSDVIDLLFRLLDKRTTVQYWDRANHSECWTDVSVLLSSRSDGHGQRLGGRNCEPFQIPPSLFLGTLPCVLSSPSH